MTAYYTNRALEILRDEGPVELSKAFISLIKRKVAYTPTLIHIQLRMNGHRAPVVPLKLYQVDPNEIEFGLLDRDAGIYPIIKDGDWDLQKELFEERPAVKSLQNHFENSVSWKETKTYQRYVEKYGSKNKAIKQSSQLPSTADSLADGLKKYDKIYNDIKTDGYKKQSEIKEYKRKPPELNEIQIAIGRRGELLWEGGQHRLAIAKILSLDEIPVRISTRHKQWQELRDKVYENGLPEKHEELRDHPDIQDILV